ncbi:MAG: hypothetical protein APF77_20150 [Clostridia bacterium BRH_c25]|nr:MAG: hypothetical protein APF77_20150 [Clostridia bacterium BRH_c25]
MSNVRSKKRTALLLLLASVLVLVILLIVNNKTAQKSSFVMEGRNKLTVAGEVIAVSNSSSLVYCIKDLLIEAQEENLRAKSINGNVAWSQKLLGKIVNIADAGEGIVIIDSQNNINYYSHLGKLLWTYKSPSEIIDIFTEDNGSFLVEYKGMTGSHAEVFTQNGSKIGNISVENAHVLSFSTGANAFSISVLDTSAESIKTKIITYDFKGDILWAKNFDNNIISKLNYGKNNKLLVLGENTIYVYKSDGSLLEEIKVEGDIRNVAISDYIVSIALFDRGKQYLACYDSNMREQSRIEIEAAPLGIFPLKNNQILYYNDELLVLTSKGELIARYKSNTDISNVYMTLDNKVYLVSNRKLQQLEYIK